MLQDMGHDAGTAPVSSTEQVSNDDLESLLKTSSQGGVLPGLTVPWVSLQNGLNHEGSPQRKLQILSNRQETMLKGTDCTGIASVGSKPPFHRFLTSDSTRRRVPRFLRGGASRYFLRNSSSRPVVVQLASRREA
jgi:hypothetical protein